MARPKVPPYKLKIHLGRIRRERNLSQEMLADALGINRSVISRIEHGKRGIRIEYLKMIADYLCISWKDLVD